MKKWDIILVVSVLSVAIIILLSYTVCSSNVKTVKISKDTEVIYTAPLNTDATFDLGTNLIKIEKGKVWVESANCKNQVCVKHNAISKNGEVIACLPNKVLIEIE